MLEDDTINRPETWNKAEPEPEPGAEGGQWAFVEVFGHRSHAGFCREVTRFGTQLLRIDVPAKGDPATHGWQTHYYGGASIFSYTPTDEAHALKANRPTQDFYLTYDSDEDGDDMPI